MVKEIKHNFNQINFYPVEQLDDIPPEIIVFKDIDSNFRMSQIVSYNDFLNSEIIKRTKLINSMKFMEWICFILEFIIVFSEIIISIVGLIYVELLNPSSITCVILTTISTALRGFTKKYMTKMEKHQALLILTKGKLGYISDRYNMALRDGEITHEEYTFLVEEYKKYEKLRIDIIQKYSS